MPEPLWTAAEIAVVTGGKVWGAFEASGVSIDTRTLEPGDLFVALAGERDGHDFAARALEKGAAGVLCARPVDGPSVQVGDTLRALEQLGAAARERAPQAKRCAVTGSVGKTSVTQAVAAALKLDGPSHNSVKSYNNHIGVPLTLARMPRDTVRAVFEIGMNHSDEIRPLTKLVRPHVAVVTTVGSAHVENFPDGELGVARAKAEIFEGLEPGGVAVLNADNKWFDLLNDAARSRGAEVWTFGRALGSRARLIEFQVGASSQITAGVAGSQVTAELEGRRVSYGLAQSGPHWGLNSLAAILAAQALGLATEDAFAALAGFAPLAGRGETHALSIGGAAVTLIDESYNANPISMRAALATLGGSKAPGRKIAVLTDMLELGEGSPAAHAALAEPIAAAGVHLAFLAGPMMRALWDILPPARRGAWRESAVDIVPEVLTVIKPGDVVMVKGSNGSQASLVVQALLDAGASAHRKAEEVR